MENALAYYNAGVVIAYFEVVGLASGIMYVRFDYVSRRSSKPSARHSGELGFLDDSTTP
jgi:hypothetical protein